MELTLAHLKETSRDPIADQHRFENPVTYLLSSY
jgi:hypothetical protein